MSILSIFLHLIFKMGFFSSLLVVATSVMKLCGRGKSKEVMNLPEINWSKYEHVLLRFSKESTSRHNSNFLVTTYGRVVNVVTETGDDDTDAELDFFNFLADDWVLGMMMRRFLLERRGMVCSWFVSCDKAPSVISEFLLTGIITISLVEVNQANL